MKTTASAKRVGFCITLCFLFAGWVARAQQASVPSADDAGSHATYLELSVAPQPLTVWPVTLSREPKAFQKEPDTGGRKVCRASFSFGAAGEESTAFLWDYTKGKIYLDLNHNRDLTDDFQGALNCPVSRFNYYVQSFTNVQLRLKTPRGSYPIVLDLQLYAPEGNRLFGNAKIRSFWEGKISLRNREYQIGRCDRAPGQFGRDNEGALLLRSWEQHKEPLDLMSGSLEAFDYTQNLFFGGQAYRVDCLLVEQDQKPKFKISFREKEVELRELRLTGQFIERLVLPATRQRQGSLTSRRQTSEASGNFTVVLDHPEGTVKVPEGDYGQYRVFLKSGGVSAYNETRYFNNSQPVLTILADPAKPTVLAAGGPLTNSVTAVARGKNLSLNYRLLGGGGEAYQLAKLDRSRPPRFVIYKDGARIHSGQFEFG